MLLFPSLFYFVFVLTDLYSKHYIYIYKGESEYHYIASVVVACYNILTNTYLSVKPLCQTHRAKRSRRPTGQQSSHRQVEHTSTSPQPFLFFFLFLQKTIQKTAENKKERKKKVIYFLGFGVKN